VLARRALLYTFACLACFAGLALLAYGRGRLTSIFLAILAYAVALAAFLIAKYLEYPRD